MLLQKLLNLVLTLLPGSRHDPNSIEARVRRIDDVVAVKIAVLEKQAAAVRAKAYEDAIAARAAARALVRSAEARIDALTAFIEG